MAAPVPPTSIGPKSGSGGGIVFGGVSGVGAGIGFGVSGAGLIGFGLFGSTLPGTFTFLAGEQFLHGGDTRHSQSERIIMRFLQQRFLL